MLAARIVAAILTLVVAFQAKSAMFPSATSIPSIHPTRVVTPTSTPKPKITKKSPSPTPTNRPSGVQNVPMVASTPTTNAIQKDTEPPVFEWMTGPEDGSTVAFNNFCFPMKINDNSREVWVRYSFDSGPGEWGKDFAPCFQNVSNGWHTFVVQAKDAAGNTVTAHSRYFNVNVPNTSTPMPTGVYNEPQ